MPPRFLARLVDVRPAEVKALAWSWLFFFTVLASYYVIRPVRDELGAAAGVSQLPWLFLMTLAGMTLANPLFSALVARMAPVRFISITYRFFALNVLVILVLMNTVKGAGAVWVGRAFWVWAAVFNMFVVSVFWAFLVDVFDNDQARRLFGFIAAGGTLGGIAGSAITAALVMRVGRSYLLIASALLLEAAVFCVHRLAGVSAGLRERRAPRQAAVGGGVLSGLSRAFKSAYLANISLYILLLAVLYTYLYFQQADIAQKSFSDRNVRTAFFAGMDLAVNILTLAIQFLLTGRILKRLGLTPALVLLPAISVAGFLALGAAPVLWVLVIVQVLRRAADFAVSRPTREVLFTVVPREDKYKAKSFIDTFVYRAGDQIGAWSYALLGWFGLAAAGISFAAALLSALWLANGLWLGRRQEKLAGRSAAEN
ncbi:MAG: MFS transporter [Bryobacterales bacterium]|nr:MFS transporter [Bryobacterales bacterium]